MNRLFGSSSGKPKPNLVDAIQSTDDRIDSIEVKIKKLDVELTRYRDQLRRLKDGAGKSAVTQRAMRVMKQKKMYETQIDQLQSQSFNMQQATLTTENLKNTMVTVDAFKVANKELRKQYKGIDIDKIEEMHYEMEDLMEQANEIQESMGRSYGVPDELDEADLEAELDALGEDFEEESLGIPSYLQQGTDALPDFIDEPPVAEHAITEPSARMNAGVV